jgi:hypothetical protein
LYINGIYIGGDAGSVSICRPTQPNYVRVGYNSF